jgi:gliding motility-associated-like protein
MKRNFLLLLALFAFAGMAKAQSALPGDYTFFPADSLSGFDRDRAYQDLGTFNAIHRLNAQEKKAFMLATQRRFIRSKYKITDSGQNRSAGSLAISSKTTQPLSAGCNNLDFENGDYTGWTGKIGYNLASASPLMVTSNGVFTFGVNAAETSCAYHTLVNPAAGNDPWGGFPMLDPGGGQYAVRLGGEKVNTYSTFCNSGYEDYYYNDYSGGEILQQSFVVSSANALFSYNYAVVLQDGGHPTGEQPYFNVSVLNGKGDTIPCLQYYVECTHGVPPKGFSKSTRGDTVYYTNWVGNSLNLTSYIGQQVTVIFTAAGCSHGGHFGYAYVDASCGPVQITTSSPTVCTGSTLTLIAPPGSPGTNYNWSKIPAGPGIIGSHTSPSITVNKAGTYEVTISYGQCSYTIDTTINFLNPPLISLTSTNVKCAGANNGTATVVATGTGPFIYSWSPIGGNGATANGLSSGNYTVTVSGAGGCSAAQTFLITEPPGLSAVSSETDLSCNGICNGSASSTCSGGTVPYSYSWNPGGQTTATASSLCAGSYTCSIRDANLCSISGIVVVHQPSALNASQVSVKPTGCANSTGSATVQVSGGIPSYTYSWSPAPGSGQGTATAGGLAQGNYTCSVLDAAGCSTSLVFSIPGSNSPSLQVVSSSNPLCNAACTGKAQVSASGGGGNYTYSWTPAGGNTATASGLCAGTFTCQVIDANGCKASQTVKITEPLAIALVIKSTPAACGFSDGKASVTASGGTGAYTYSWSPAPAVGQSTANISSLPSGTYTVLVKDANACSASATVVVNNLGGPLVSLASSSNPVCKGNCTGTAAVSVSGGTPAYTFSWSPSGGNGATAAGLCAGNYTCNIHDASGCLSSQQVTITEPTQLNANAASTNISCQGNCDGTANVSPSGGSPVYTYSWSPSNQTGASVAGLCPNTYTCSVTDSKGCKAMATLLVTEPAALTIIPTQTDVSCNGGANGTASVKVSGGTPGSGYTYSWSPASGAGQGTSSVSQLGEGNYSCIVTDAHGCSVSQKFSINEPKVLAALVISQNLNCKGNNNGQISLSVTGGAASYSYSWSPNPPIGQGTAQVKNLPAGVWHCLITDQNGCTDKEVIAITQPSQLNLITISSNISCNGINNGTATVLPSGGTPGTGYIYSWLPIPGSGQGTSQAGSLSPGSYTCKVIDSLGCSVGHVFSITQPAALVLKGNALNTTCNQNNGQASVNATGGSGSYTYVWSPATANMQTGATATNLSPGIYTCSVKDSLGCKTAVTDTIINIGNHPNAAIVVLGNPILCSQAWITLVASGGSSYQWSNGAGADSIRVNMPGVYTVYASNSCGIDSARQAITGMNKPSLILSGGGTLCAGDSIPLIASGGASYLWSTGSTHTTITVSNSGIYYVVSGNRCGTDTAFTQVNMSSVHAYFGASPLSGIFPLPVNFADSSSSNAVSWSWNFGNGATGSGKNPAYTFPEPGSYPVTLTVTNADGCTNTFTKVIVVDALPSWIIIPNVFTPNGDGNNDNFHVLYAGITEFNARIYDRWGLELSELVTVDQGWDGRTSGGTPASAGTYYYIIKALGDDGKKYDFTGFLMLLR